MTVHVVGLGPAGPEAAPAEAAEVIRRVARVVVRTRHHPAVGMVSDHPEVVYCDDLYESAATFDEVYLGISERVLEAAAHGDVAYLVPGSPRVGERSVPLVEQAATSAGIEVEVHHAESFLDALLAVVGVDPLADGLQVLDGHDLPRPLSFALPTVIGHLDIPEVLADVLSAIDRVVPEGHEVAAVADAGSRDSTVVWAVPTQIAPQLASLRTSLFVPATTGGLAGAVRVMERLRAECPWDRTQTHETLLRHLREETAELAEAVAALQGSEDWTGYAAVEDELGDVLLQVLFHAEIARTEGVFDIGDVAEHLRRKLVRRHPHVFGEVPADDPEAVKANWQSIKEAERAARGEAEPSSALDGIPVTSDALLTAELIGDRAARVGFDWPDSRPVIDDLVDEVIELREAETPAEREHELGDVLFAAVNVARHLGVDPELSLRRANQRFVERFRRMEAHGPLEGLDLDELNRRWDAAKRELTTERANEGD